MPASRLPDDCIYDIVKNFRNNRSTLFKCLLVNRFWCKVIVPFLYMNPFENFNHHHNYSIIPTLILCFNETETSHLKNQLRILNIPNIETNVDYRPLFEYSSYLEIYDDSKVNDIILKWFTNHRNVPYYKDLENFIPIFHHLILRQSINIKQLNIQPALLLDNTIFSTQFIQNIGLNLSELNSLSLYNIGKLDNNLELKFLESIANNCLNIKQLKIKLYKKITFPPPSKEICSIIQKQQNLKMIKLTNSDTILNNILLSLKFQRNSLVYINFKDINFEYIPFEHLIDLCNLQYLTFNVCKMVKQDHCNFLQLSSFSLKELTLYNTVWHSNITQSIIKYLGSSLHILSITENLIIPISVMIPKYCMNLDTLEIKINTNMDISIFSYLKDLKIKNLNLIIFIINLEIMDDIFNNLAKNLPENVKSVSFLYCEFFDYFCFKEFLNNCHGNLETINLQYNITSYYFETILYYTERCGSNLKLLGIKSLEKVWSEKELKLLDRIMAKGVNVVKFDSIYKNRAI